RGSRMSISSAAAPETTSSISSPPTAPAGAFSRGRKKPPSSATCSCRRARSATCRVVSRYARRRAGPRTSRNTHHGARRRSPAQPPSPTDTPDTSMTMTPLAPSAPSMNGATQDDYLRSRWDDALASRMDPVERLIYRSNILGADARITNTGGGNTSSKISVKDPLTGETTRVLWVKGSGGDLRTATKSNFASLYLDQVLNLRTLYEKYPQRGPKTPAEDAMVGMYPYTTFDRNPTAASIDTPLHSNIPYAHVDHMHPVAVIALATAKDGPAL